MSRKAWGYIALIFLAAGLIIVFSVLQLDPGNLSWTYFIVLTVFTSVSQLFKAEAPAHQLYHPNLMFLFAGALLLEPGLFVAQVVITHLVEWAKERWIRSEHLQAWYIQTFNISMHIILGFVSRHVFYLVIPDGGEIYGPLGFSAAILSAGVYVTLNHLMVGEALVLARGVSWTESGIMELENLGTDFVMLLMGYIGAVVMQLNIWLLVLLMAPLFLIYRSLMVPNLRQLADTDPKTGLWNSKYFNNALLVEMNRARRFERPLTVVMADLDYLRNINNTHGHIAGDAVIIGVANILREQFREYDILARFGGDEFSLLMAETSPELAFDRVEEIRKVVESAVFFSPATRASMQITISFGIAGMDDPDMSPDDIIHLADSAVYASKASGRNQTRIYSAEMVEQLGVVASGTAS